MIRLAILIAATLALAGCILPPPPHGGWYDPRWHGGDFNHGGFGRR